MGGCPCPGCRNPFDVLRGTMPLSPLYPNLGAIAEALPDPIIRSDLDVTKGVGEMAYWLETNLGRGALSGYFIRPPRMRVVYTPSEGESGYVEPRDGDDDGPAQVRELSAKELAAHLTYTFNCHRKIEVLGGDPVRSKAIFPVGAAEIAVNAADRLPGLRRLAGVVHAPIVRRDGTVLDEPGYDETTRLLYLPPAGLDVPPVRAEPTPADVAAAVALLDEMTAGFPWQDVKLHKPNYYGLLLTPMLRELCPPPYKMFAVNAHQPGSGKTLLANLARIVHGGVFRSEFPADESELGKAVAGILHTTTAPLVVFDNCSGVLRSSKLAGLLTSATYADRILGSTNETTFANDRVWTITGNNLALGGDLVRRTINIAIDPGRPNPEKRTDFVITDLEGWARANRGRLIGALITLIRAWVVAGSPREQREQSDGYAAWAAAVGGILAVAGIPGTFDADDSRGQQQGDDDEDWGTFLSALHAVYGEAQWTVADMLSKIADPRAVTVPSAFVPATPRIPRDALPEGMTHDKMGRERPSLSAKAVGKWLGNRQGRWAANLTIRSGAKVRDGVPWRIEVYRPPAPPM